NVPDVFAQLRRGKVTVSVAQLAKAMPDDYVNEKAFAGTEVLIPLSLALVVTGIGIEALKQQTPVKMVREFDISRMADPFKEPDELLPLLIQKTTRIKKKTRPKKDDTIQSKIEVAPDESRPSGATSWFRKDDSDLEMAYREFPGNINLNVATVEELQMLKGVDAELAEAIIAYRDKQKGFKTIFELAQITGVDDNRFRKITGMPASGKKYHRRKRLAGLLKISPEQITDLNLVVSRLSKKPGFSGCVISDMDGLVLAQRGVDELGEGLCAVVPRMIQRIREDMELVGAGQIGTITMAIDGVLYTISASENVALTAVHAEDHVSQTDLSFIRKVAKELAWLLSMRAYVGPNV
ncbi:MAG: helix-hairpin-helix domain-containing protein, partial [Lentisphaerae bacterium]|nr:helix-hairpin-helix domain-containing protein [Lentisphaerota bacterium]